MTGSQEFQFNVVEALKARSRLHGLLQHTPVLASQVTSGLYLKAENLQVTGSFKIRPAFNQLAALTPEQRQQGAVTSSSGNFAQGAAYAARQLGVSIKVVMMRSSNPLKVEKTRGLGAEVVFCEDHFEARFRRVQEIQEEEGRAAVHPFDSPLAIAGNATIGLELLEQLEEIRHVVVPVSGGGLIAGISALLRLKAPKVRIWGIQPEGSNAACLSYQAGRPVSIEKAETVADGLTATRPGILTCSLMSRFVDGMYTVGEESILEAVRQLAVEEKLVVEPSGAVPLAAILEGKVPVERTVLILSGGNILPALLARILSQA